MNVFIIVFNVIKIIFYIIIIASLIIKLKDSQNE